MTFGLNSDIPTGLAAAEARARQNGYKGIFPPPRTPKPKNAREMQALLRKINKGDATANNLSVAENHIASWAMSLSVNSFRGYAQTLIDIALGRNRNDSQRVRLRAIESHLRIALDLLAMVPQIAERGDRTTPSEDHLRLCLDTFLEQFTPDVFTQLQAVLNRITENPQADTAIRAIQIATAQARYALKVLLHTHGRAAAGRTAPKRVSPKLRKGLQEIEERVLAVIRPKGQDSDRESTEADEGNTSATEPVSGGPVANSDLGVAGGQCVDGQPEPGGGPREADCGSGTTGDASVGQNRSAA